MAVGGASAYVARRGDPGAGAVFLTVAGDAGLCLYAPAGPGGEDGERLWREAIAAGPQSHEAVAVRLAREASFDPDHWVIDVEDRAGRHFLAGALAVDRPATPPASDIWRR